MASSPTTAEQIQQQMQQVRTDLREDVRELVISAREMAVWQRYVQAYPWACLGTAALLGYLIVPPRTHLGTIDAQRVADLVNSRISEHVAPQDRPSGTMLSNLVAGAAGIVVKGLMQQGLSILGQQLQEHLFRSQASRFGEPHTNGQEQ